MASVLRMLFVVFCPLLVLSESGDDDWSEKEVTCTSILTLKQSNLTCSLNDESNKEVEFAKLCQMTEKKKCKHATLGPEDFTFENVRIMERYKLEVYLRDEVIEQVIDMLKIVKIPAPDIKLATYMEDTEEVFIWLEHSHEYVSKPSFQVEIWGDKLANKSISATINYRNFSISRDRLGGDGVYYTRVRAKPVDFFSGDWSKWSSTVSFTIKTNSTELLKITSRSSLHIAVGFSIFLVLIIIIIIILGVLLWRMHIKGYFTAKHPAAESNSHTNAKGERETHIMDTVPAQSLDACGPSCQTPQPQMP
ncbi:interleukin-7 receptor subunit alpha-like isoform X1 [Megalobrama amblycephala]|uniref:interleukin-7 receptor subunit alpha-like isoform X1 n=1 Tax=Megalobrama amblycephala TaxID=75352 RepID=UPI0020147119|nr:interleukin-7 receptor subunit alpha-like isoform X1 [Megalobrama amblycephala]